MTFSFCAARWPAAMVLAVGCACFAHSGTAQDDLRIVRIEEQWEMVLAEPDGPNTAPQVTTAFSPLGNLSSLHATFEINHLATPEFAPGGLHLHAWNGEQRLDSKHQAGGIALQTAGEVVRWKQVLRFENNALVLEVVDGHSTTWGEFGESERLRVSLPTTLTSLNGYSPDVSARQSGVGFANNRVARLALTKVSATTASGLVVEDDTDRVAHELE